MGWGWGVSTPSQAAFKHILPALGGLGREPFSNRCLDKTLRLGMKWKPVGPTVFYSAVDLRRKAQAVFSDCHGVNTGAPAAGNGLAPEPCLPRPLGPCPQEKAAFLSPVQPRLGFRSHQPLWRLLWNRPLRMSSVRGDSESGCGGLLHLPAGKSRGPDPSAPRAAAHQQHLSPWRWEDASPCISSISAHGAGRMLRRALSSKVVCF